MWMGISTNGIGKIAMPVAAPANKAAKDTDTKNSFADIMELSGNGKVDAGKTPADKKPADVKSTKEASDSYDATATAGEKINRDFDSADEVNKYDQKDNVNSDQKTEDVNKTSASEQPDSMKDTIKKVIDKIYDILEEKLGCTEQDIEDVLENMGMMLQDLLSPDNLRDFVLQFHNATEVDLLISEQLPNLIEDIQNTIVDILDDFGVTAEDVSKFLETLQSKQMLTENVPEEFVAEEEQQAKTGMADNDENLTNFDKKVDIVSETSQSEDSSESVIVREISQSAASSKNMDTAGDNQSSIAMNLNQAMEQAVTSGVEGAGDFGGDVARADIIRQVIEAVRVNLSSDQTSMTLQLNPENLGRVQISVIQKNGVMQAQIIAENEAAKNAIEGNLALLQESLEHQELKVESVEVMIASYEFFNQQEEQSNEQNSNQANRRMQAGEIDAFDEGSEEEVLEEEIMRAQGNSVNYSI